MARGTQHRKRRPTANARVAQPVPAPKRAKAKVPGWEDQLFFSRLRHHAKWVFVFLALAFGLGFVLFGVGSGSTGITQAMQNLFNSSSGGGSSLSSLQKKVKQHPKNAAAWRALASKLEQDQKVDRSIVALQHYVKLAPKDESSLQELAGLYTRRASDYYNLYNAGLARSQIVSPNSIFRPSPKSALGKAYANQDPFLTLANTGIQAKQNAALTRLSVLNSQSENAYKKLVKLAPDNASYQIQLGEVATNLGDTPTAEKALKTFLKLAPNDSLAPTAKQALKQLAASAAKTTTTAKKSGGG